MKAPYLSIPDFVAIQELSCYPDYQETVAQRVNKYFQEHWEWNSSKERDEYGQQELELWALLTCPQAPESRAEIASIYAVFLFFYDDLLEKMSPDEAKKSIMGVKEVLLHSHEPRNTIEKVVHDIRTRMESFGDENSRTLAHLAHVEAINYMEAVVDHEERKNSIEEGLEAYLKYRMFDIAFLCTYRISAWEVDLVTTPPHLLDDPEFKALVTLAGNHEVLVNDMYSYRREAKLLEQESEKSDPSRGDENIQDQVYFLYNAVCVLLRDNSTTPANVMDRLAECIRQNEFKYNASVKQLMDKYGSSPVDLDTVKSWVLLLTDIMAGNYIWCKMSPRYNV